jgi:hypothetical protein
MVTQHIAQNTITFGTAFGWSLAALNFLILVAIGLLTYIYNQDKANNNRNIDLLEKKNEQRFASIEEKLVIYDTTQENNQVRFHNDIRSLELNARRELKEGMEDLEKHLNSRIMDAMDRIDGKLESISKDTKKIGELEQRVATAANDIDWLKRNAK